MQARLARFGALTLAAGMLTLIVGHAALSGCRSATPEVLTPSAEAVAVSTARAAKPAETSPNAVNVASDTTAAPTPMAPKMVKPGAAPVFMGASKAAPVFRGDQVHDLAAPQPQGPAQQKPSPAP